METSTSVLVGVRCTPASASPAPQSRGRVGSPEDLASLPVACTRGHPRRSPSANASFDCNRVELAPEDKKGHTAINPILVVEVLNPSTEAYDRGEKLAHYKTIASLREILLVAHDERRIDLWRWVGEGWTQRTAQQDEVVELTSIGVRLQVADVYFDPLEVG